MADRTLHDEGRPVRPLSVDDEVKLATLRHPAGSAWDDLTGDPRLRHIALGDLIDTLEAVGLELRIQTRRIS